MTLVIALGIAVAVGLGYAGLANRVASAPRAWHWPLLALYVFAALPVLLPDTGFLIAGGVGLIGTALGFRRTTHRWALAAATLLLLSPLLIFRFTLFPIPNLFTSR